MKKDERFWKAMLRSWRFQKWIAADRGNAAAVEKVSGRERVGFNGKRRSSKSSSSLGNGRVVDSQQSRSQYDLEDDSLLIASTHSHLNPFRISINPFQPLSSF
jgi:hypothetical protein